ncbi:hypothetical protein [Nocardioides cynanchi]|uniref:hypothetical protein n=1 Tax=Nocardioides cynanchi TaxID=2558918 RepID=UPI001248D8AE|nr:hypothetical protein [Nocardioides cynanchi]
MTAGLPDGYVDPTDPLAVGAVLEATARTSGLDAVTDLLTRLPGTRTTPATPKGFLRSAVPASVWLGPESCWSCTEPPTLLHVVGGVVLQRTEVQPGDVGAALSRVVADLVRRTGQVDDASAALTAARDVAAGL